MIPLPEAARQLRRLAVVLSIVAIAASAGAQDIEIELFTGGQEWVRKNGEVELLFTRFPRPEEGALAVVVGAMDRTELFRRTDRGLRYRPELLPLPAGETEIVVYLVTADGEWREFRRLPLRVLRTGGLESFAVTPRLDLGLKAQVAESHRPGGNRPARQTFQDLSLQFDFQATARRRGFTIEPRMNVVGTSFQREALRFSSEGERAPRVDLASYGVRIDRGRGYFQLGHLAYGDHRMLIQGFGSRGLEVGVPLGKRVTASAAAINGSQIVGWDNFSGISESRHRLLSGTLAVEVLNRPGALRLAASYLDAEVLPQFGFNQNQINDTEKSRGWGARLLAATKSQRIRLDGGLARSRFDNPFDPALAQGANLVEVQEDERGARYLDLALGLVQRSLGERGSLAVDLALRHARVDPLFRSIGAFVAADREENAADLSTRIGPAAVQLSHARSSDNLDRIRSLPTTKNQRSGAILSLPLGQLWSKAQAPRNALPLFSYTVDHNHQFGIGLPEGGGLNPSQIPDQVSVNQTAGLDWQTARFRLGLAAGQSDQDNRQPGREAADFTVKTRSLRAGGSLHRRLDLGLEVGREQSENFELRTANQTVRYGGDLTWRILERLTLTTFLSRSRSEDRAGTSESSSWSSDTQLVWGFERRRGERHGTRGQLFLRVSDLAADSLDRSFGFASDTALRTLNAGLNLSLF